MKRILFILFFTIISGVVFSQDTTTGVYNDQRGNFFIKVENVPAWQIDGYNKVIRNGDTLTRIRANGVMTAEELNILPNGSNMASQINTIANIPAIKAIRFVFDSARSVAVSANINLQGKQLIFENGANLTGTFALSNATIQADKYSRIFDTTITFSNIKTADGNFYPTWFGAVADGATDVSAIFKKSADAAASNGLILGVPGSFYLGGTVSLLDNTVIKGDDKIHSTILMPNNAYLHISGNKSNIHFSNFKFISTDSVVSTNFSAIYFNGSDSITDVSVNNVDFYLEKRHSIAVQFKNVRRGSITNCNSFESRAQGYWVESSNNVSISHINVYNAGRSGIALYQKNRMINVTDFIVDGFAQNIELADGGIDIYGDDNEQITIANGNIRTGMKSYNNVIQHDGIRAQGVRNSLISNVNILMESQYGLYGVRVANRNNYYAENVTLDNIHIKVTGRCSKPISFQGFRNPAIYNSSVYIDTAATYTTSSTSPTIITVDAVGAVDTITTVTVYGFQVNTSGNAFPIVMINTPVKALSITGSSFINSGEVVGKFNSWVGSFRYSGNTVISTRTQSVILTTESVRSFIITDNIVYKPGSNFFTISSSGYTGDVVQNNNIVNNVKHYPSGGGLYGSSITFANSSYTLPDSIGVVNFNRTAGAGTLTLPTTYPAWKNRIVVCNNIGATYKVYVPDITPAPDTLNPGQSSIYHYDGSAWRIIASNKASLSVSGDDPNAVKLTGNQTVAGTKTFSTIPVLPASNPTTDNQAVRKKYVDDLLAGQDTLKAAIYKNATRDSAIFEFNNQRFAVKDSTGKLTLTTTGTSGAATYNSSTGVLNVPQYSGGGSSVSFGTSGQIPFMNSGETDFGYSGNFKWDNANGRLGINNSSPAYEIDVNGAIKVAASNGFGLLIHQSDNTYRGRIGASSASGGKVVIESNSHLNILSGAQNGVTIKINGAATASLDIVGATTSNASLRIRPGETPNSPNTGDFYVYNSDNKPYYYDGSNWIDLTAGGGGGEIKKSKVVNNADYTIEDSVSAVIIRSASTSRNITLPTAWQHPGREITVYNNSNLQHIASTTITYDSATASAYLNPKTWVRIKSSYSSSFGDYLWHAIGKGSTFYETTGTYTPDTSNHSGLVNISKVEINDINYMRENDMITVYGKATVYKNVLTEGTLSTVIITLPKNAYYSTLSGSATLVSGTALHSNIIVEGDAGGSRFTMTWKSATGEDDETELRFHFSYKVRW